MVVKMVYKFQYEIRAWVWNAKKAEYDLKTLANCKSFKDALAIYEQTKIDGKITQCDLIQYDGETIKRLALKDETGEYEQREW